MWSVPSFEVPASCRSDNEDRHDCGTDDGSYLRASLPVERNTGIEPVLRPWQGRGLPLHQFRNGADDGIRTHDLDLGKVALYHSATSAYLRHDSRLSEYDLQPNTPQC